MLTITVREVQHNLAKYLHIVETGEQIQINRHNRPVAKIIPISQVEDDKTVDWDEHFGIIEKVFKGRVVKGKPMEKIVTESRGEY